MMRRLILGALAAGLLAVAPAEAFTFVRAATGTNAGATTTATLVPAAITAGSLVIVTADGDGNGPTGCVDTLGNTYTAVAATLAYNSTTGQLRAFWSVAATGGASPTITCTFAAAGTISFAFVVNSEYTPCGTVTTDGTTQTTAAGTTYDSGGITTTGSSDLLIGYVNGNGTAPATPASWTNRGGLALNANLSDRLGAAVNTYHYTAGGATAGWGAVIAAFFDGGCGGGCIFGGGIISPRCPG